MGYFGEWGGGKRKKLTELIDKLEDNKNNKILKNK